MYSNSQRCVGAAIYPAEPGVLIGQLREDEAVAEAGTLLLAVPIQSGGALQCACSGGNSDHCRPNSWLAPDCRWGWLFLRE